MSVNPGQTLTAWPGPKGIPKQNFELALDGVVQDKTSEVDVGWTKITAKRKSRSGAANSFGVMTRLNSLDESDRRMIIRGPVI